jgi:flagellar hook-basal body protein
LIGSYNNNTSRRLYRIPLASFVEPNELQSISGNLFAITQESGGVTFSRPTDNATGELKGGALENSNVETEDQLVNMIVAQRAYQSNSQTITTSNEMLQTLDRMLG